MEMDSLGNIGVVGQSTDLTLVSSSLNTFVGLFENTGFNFTWVREFTVATHGIINPHLVFKADNTQLVAMISSNPLTLVILSTLDGTLLA